MSWNPSLDPGCPDAVGVDAHYTFDPVQPHQSSTGRYSGGTPSRGAVSAST